MPFWIHTKGFEGKRESLFPRGWERGCEHGGNIDRAYHKLELVGRTCTLS